MASYFLQLNSLSYVISVTGHHVTKFELNFAKYSCSIIAKSRFYCEITGLNMPFHVHI